MLNDGGNLFVHGFHNVLERFGNVDLRDPAFALEDLERSFEFICQIFKHGVSLCRTDRRQRPSVRVIARKDTNLFRIRNLLPGFSHGVPPAVRQACGGG